MVTKNKSLKRTLCLTQYKHLILFIVRHYRYVNNGQGNQPPPPPYSATYEPAAYRRELNSLHAASPYGMSQCPIHRLQPCACMQTQHCNAREVRIPNNKFHGNKEAYSPDCSVILITVTIDKIHHIYIFFKCIV